MEYFAEVIDGTYTLDECLHELNKCVVAINAENTKQLWINSLGTVPVVFVAAAVRSMGQFEATHGVQQFERAEALRSILLGKIEQLDVQDETLDEAVQTLSTHMEHCRPEDAEIFMLYLAHIARIVHRSRSVAHSRTVHEQITIIRSRLEHHEEIEETAPALADLQTHTRILGETLLRLPARIATYCMERFTPPSTPGAGHRHLC